MNRSIQALTVTFVLAAGVVGCNRAGAAESSREAREAGLAEQNLELEARQRANAAVSEANQQVQSAQAAAQRDIAAARTDFERVREDYRHVRMSDLNELDERIADLQAAAKTATGQMKANLESHLPALRTRREAFARDLQGLDTATSATWDQARAKVDAEWYELKAAVDQDRKSTRLNSS